MEILMLCAYGLLFIVGIAVFCCIIVVRDIEKKVDSLWEGRKK